MINKVGFIDPIHVWYARWFNDPAAPISKVKVRDVPRKAAAS